MTQDSTKVRAGIAGGVSVGPLTAAAPTGTASALTGFTDLGFISDEGLTLSRDRNTEKIKAWQNASVIRTLITEASITYKFTLVETKKEVIELVWGTTVTSTAVEGNYLMIPASTGGKKSFVFDVFDGAELERHYLAIGEVTEVGDIKYVSDDVYAYEVTVEGYYSATLGASGKIWSTALKT
jgi:hypothetical protein